MTRCARCGHEFAGQSDTCPRCGAPTGIASPGDSFTDEGDRTVIRPGLRPQSTASPAPDQGPWTVTAEPGGPAPAPQPAPAPGMPQSGWVPYGPSAPAAADRRTVNDPMPPASLGTRFAAHLLDGLILTGAILALYLVLLVLVTSATWLLGNLSYTVANAVAGLLSVVGFLAYIAVLVGYVVWGWANGQTLGKRAMKIAVVDVMTGQPIGVSRAIVRYLMMAVMGLPCYLGYLSVLAADGRGWHDKAANSRVVICPDWPAPVLFRKR